MPKRITEQAKHFVDGCEQVLLAALLDGVPELSVTSEDFGSPVNRKIFDRIMTLPVGSRCLIAVTEELRRKGELTEVGGSHYVTYTSGLPHGDSNLTYALEQVLETARARRAVGIGKRLQDGSLTANDAQAELMALTETVDKALTIRRPEEIVKLPRAQYLCLLGDWLFALGQSLVIAGASGIGKSRLAMQLIVALITGRDWCGIRTHGRRVRCLIIQTENPNHRLKEELEAIKKWTGKDWGLVNENLFVHTLESDSDSLLHLSDPKNGRRLESTIRNVSPDVVCFDPLRDISIGDLNSDVDMSLTLRELGRISRAGNPERGIIIVHHAITGRSGAAKAFGLDRAGFARNSKVLHSWARAVVNMIPGTEDDNETLVLTCGKISNGKEFSPIAIRLNDRMIYETEENFDIEAWRRHITGQDKKRKLSPEILQRLQWPQKQLKRADLVDLLKKEKICGNSRAYTLIEEALSRGLLRFDNRTHMYALV